MCRHFVACVCVCVRACVRACVCMGLMVAGVLYVRATLGAFVCEGTNSTNVICTQTNIIQ